ncbi:MAG: cytochrome c oxidase assembly protein [Candidatus Competibacteraceae bacterium]|nr:cytochrome c oxidase assembly protein [Candidatus Competibacteraceae bacterium]
MLALASVPAVVSGHGREHGNDTGLPLQWNFDPGTTVPLLLAALVYGLGVCRLWRRAGIGRGLSWGRVGAFSAGLLTLVMALVSPLEAMATELFSLHMVQHLLLILIAPPLLILGQFDLALLWALPRRWRPIAGRIEGRLGRFLDMRGQGGPLLVAVLATGALWVWHLPGLYDLAVQDQAVHYAEHTSFIVTALLFWAMILRLRPRDHLDNGLRLLYVFAMAFQGSLLGALITFTSRPLYTSYAAGSAAWELTPLEDQQIAGLIMWVPPAFLYLGVICYLFVNWLAAVSAHTAAATPFRKTAPPSYGVVERSGESKG